MPTTEENDRLRIHFAFWKFILGSVVLGAATIIINWQIQDKKLEFENRNTENQFVAQFVDHALDQNLERRRDFAEYFTRLAPTEESRQRWENYRNFVEKRVQEAIAREKTVQEKEQQLAGALEKLAIIEKEKAKAIEDAKKAKKVAKKVSEELKARVRDAEQKESGLKSQLAIVEAELGNERRELAALRSEPQPGAIVAAAGWSKLTAGILSGETLTRNYVAKKLLLGQFDLDKSGSIDTPREVAKIPCSVWRALYSVDPRFLIFFGFDPKARWQGYIFGFDESVREVAFKAANKCIKNGSNR